jgi:DNA-binding IclR family transcriptional regulator
MIKAVAKAIEIMNTFTPAEPRLTLAEIARRRGLPKSTAHNLLATLVAYGLVEKLEDDYYALGIGIIPLTQCARVNVELRDRAAPLLRQLADATRESVYLTVLDGLKSLYIYAIESPGRLLARSVVGDRVPLHCTAVGKAMLAALSDAELEQVVTEVGLTSYTPATITDPQALRNEVQKTRARGYALDTEEHEERTYCIGAPILNDRGRVIAACSISGPDPEIVGSKLSMWSQLVRNTAQDISRRMGYVPVSMSALSGIIPTSRY